MALEVAAQEKTLVEYSTGIPASLVSAIAEYVTVPPENVFVSAGSDEVLRAITSMCARRGILDAIGGVPTYTHFVHFVAQAGLRWHPVIMGIRSTSDDRVALVELHGDLLERGCLVYLVSPNNPTGDTWSRDTVSGWATKYPKSIFLVDEAYTEFAGVETLNCNVSADVAISIAAAMNAASLASLTSTRENVVVARTFSKAFGLAGLRIGYGIACASLADAISTFVNPKAVTALAAACAEACLSRDALAYYHQCATESTKQRKRLCVELQQKGWYVEAGGGNFMLLFVGNSKAVTEKLSDGGIYVRDRSDLPELHGFVRITSGRAEDTEAILSALAETKIPAEPIQKFYTPKTVIAKLRRYLSLSAPILKRHAVQWWMCEGSLVGLKRQGGIIPWDDDIDLGYVFPEDGRDPVAGLADEFAKVGLTLQRNRTNAYWQIGVDLPKSPTGPVHECIDLFPYHLDAGSGFYLNADPRFRQENPDGTECNTKYTFDELLPLADAPFYEDVVPVPAKADAVLDRALGREWKTIAVVRSVGATRRFPIADYSPA